jgi:hypothetical protein
MEARGRIKIRPGEVTLALLAALAYGVAVAVLVPPVWPLMPFPQVPPVRVIAALSFLFGLVLRRRWVPALPFTILLALAPPESGFAGSLIALLVLSPFAAASALLGLATGRRLKRAMLRRALRTARAPASAERPGTAEAPVRAARSERLPAAGAGR